MIGGRPHSVALPGDLTVRGKIVRMGGQFSVAEARQMLRKGEILDMKTAVGLALI